MAKLFQVAIALVATNIAVGRSLQPPAPAIAGTQAPQVSAKSEPPAQTSGELTAEQAIALIDQWSAGEVEQTKFARVIGAAEGTRDRDGGKNEIYEGHVDPGNGVWNRGSFSYQFGNNENLSPEEASRRQLKKILGHLKDTVIPQSKQQGIKLTPWELMNAADLANQAPLCITESGGYVERLVQARKKGKEKGWSEYEVVLNARIESFWDAAKNTYDAPGLRAYDDMGKRVSVLKDQDRRMNEMRHALSRQFKFAVKGGESGVENVSYTKRSPGIPTGKVPGRSRGDRVAVY